MKRQLILALLLMALGLELQACESCGCSVSSGGLSFLSQIRTNYIGVRWQYAAFRGADSDFRSTDQLTRDYFNRVELRGRYFLSRRLHLNAVLPFVYNDRNSVSAPTQVRGIGDASLILTANLINTAAQQEQLFVHFLSLGAGVELPLGQYSGNQYDDRPDNFNTGSGSTDLQFQLNYVLTMNEVGLSTQLSYQWNTRNKDDYKFGNQYAASLVFFWRKGGERFSFLPFAGFSAELVKEDELQPDFNQHGTGGRGLFASLGTEVYFGRFALNVAYQAPLKQMYSAHEVVARNRISLGINFLI